MSTRDKDLQKVQDAFDSLFKFADEQDRNEVEAKALMARFLSELQPVIEERKLKRKELAELIGTSASYLTQLYRGHKLINLVTLAKLERVLGVRFSIALEGQSTTTAMDEEVIAEHLDRFYQSRSGEFIKVVRNYSFKASEGTVEPKLPDLPSPLRIAS
jgi:transcriptional regulator with XRE-family HTH domain